MKKILGIIFLSFLCSSFGTSAEINLECEPKAYGENNPIIYKSLKIKINLDLYDETKIFFGGSMWINIEGYKNLEDQKSNSYFRKEIAKPILYYDEDIIIYPSSLSDKKKDIDSKIKYFETNAVKKYLFSYSDEYEETILMPIVESAVTTSSLFFDTSRWKYGDTSWNLNCFELGYNDSESLILILGNIVDLCNNTDDREFCVKSKFFGSLKKYDRDNIRVYINTGKKGKTRVSFDPFNEKDILLKIALGLMKNNCEIEKYLTCLIKRYNP